MSANDRQIGGEHYKNKGYEPWDFTADMLGGCFFLGNANKYITRWRAKNGLEDLQKASHYLEKAIELNMLGRLPIRVFKSSEAIKLVVDHYSQAHNLNLIEESLLTHMCEGQLSKARFELLGLIEREGRRDK